MIILGISVFCDFGGIFVIFYGIPEARVVFQNLPEPRSSTFPKYEPVAIHIDPIRAQN